MKKTMIRNISKVMLRGCIAALVAMLAFTLAVLAVALYVHTASASGYMAVIDFAVATICAALFLLDIYVLGALVANAGKFPR